MQMHDALVGEENVTSAASCLLKGMTRCNLTNDQNIDFICNASKLLGDIKRQRLESKILGKLRIYLSGFYSHSDHSDPWKFTLNFTQ